MWPLRVATLDVYAGDDHEATYRFERSGEPYPLTDWTGWACVWRRGSRTLTPTLDTSRLAEGVLTLRFSAAQTRAMQGAGELDVEAVRAGQTRTWLRAATTWTDDITRREEP